jgi:hypothetical protein
LVPIAKNLALLPGIVEELPASEGVAKGVEVVDSPFIVPKGSSSRVRRANEEESIALVVISTPGCSFKDKIEDRHSSIRDVEKFLATGLPGRLGDCSGEEALAGLITVPPKKMDAIGDRSRDDFLAGVITLPPPNNDAMLGAVFGTSGGVLGRGYSSRGACSDFHLVNLLISACSPSPIPRLIANTPSPAPLPSSPAKSTSKLLRISHPSQILRKCEGR